MLQFILTNLIMLAVGVMLYLFVRSLPRIEDQAAGSRQRQGLERLLASEIPEKVDRALHISSTKLLRRARVLILKADNVLSGKIQQVSQAQHKAPSLGFEDLQNIDTLPVEGK